jgi:hypothetical protein
MRTVDEVRTRKLEDVGSLVRRSGMHATSGRGMDIVARGLFYDLCFIDERDAEFATEIRRLDRYGKQGVSGAFEAVFGPDCNFVSEVASVFAEVFHGFGYLDLERRLDAVEWRGLVDGVREEYELTDSRQSHVLARHGKPSLVVDGRVFCYAVAGAASGWVFFDFWEEYARSYVEGGGFTWTRNDDLLLRDIRVPSDTFEESLVLTIWGKVLRWGEAWQIERPDADPLPGSDPEILEQLRSIHRSDPSQSLGPGGPNALPVSHGIHRHR